MLRGCKPLLPLCAFLRDVFGGLVTEGGALMIKGQYSGRVYLLSQVAAIALAWGNL